MNEPERSLKVVGDLRVITCFCGCRILLVPDVKEMSKAIEVHVEEHVKKEKNPLKAAEEAERIQLHLITQILALASEAKP